MESIKLKNKPLVEAIFELRWELQEMPGGYHFDPDYKISIGRLYENLKSKYPTQEKLNTATMPDEIAGHVVQYRFRTAENEWPLVQIGPGIVTLNETEKYTWNEFKDNITQLIDTLLLVRKGNGKLHFKSLLLRYIDAIEFNYDTENIFEFLRDKMKLKIEFKPELFENTQVNSIPINFDQKFSFSSEKPRGTASLRFFKGQRQSVDSLLWETMVVVKDEKTLNTNDNIIKCLEEAHDLTHNWFFNIISGELEERFK